MFGSRLKVYRNVMQRLIGFCCTTTGTAQDLGTITPEAIFAFLDGYAGKAGWRLPYVRNILRFLFWSGRTPRDLSDAISVAPAGRAHGLPRHLQTSVVRKLLDAVRGDCAIALRDHARLLLMARLGLRAQEVLAIRLDDIDWGAGQMLVRAKGRQLHRVPVPVDVGEAIVTWLCNARKGNSRHLCVCVRPPYAPFTSSQPVRSALGKASRRAGLVAPDQQRPMQGTTTGRCVRWLAGGRCREGNDAPGR